MTFFKDLERLSRRMGVLFREHDAAVRQRVLDEVLGEWGYSPGNIALMCSLLLARNDEPFDAVDGSWLRCGSMFVGRWMSGSQSGDYTVNYLSTHTDRLRFNDDLTYEREVSTASGMSGPVWSTTPWSMSRTKSDREFGIWVPSNTRARRMRLFRMPIPSGTSIQQRGTVEDVEWADVASDSATANKLRIGVTSYVRQA